MPTFTIKEVPGLSGSKARCFSILIEGDEETSLERLFSEIDKIDEKATNEIYQRIYNMTNRYGFRDHFFKFGEGNLGDGVVALSVGKYRVYCWYRDSTFVFFGGGGLKDKRTYQEVTKLNKEASIVKAVAKKLNQACLDKTILFNDDATITLTEFFDNQL